MKESIIKFFTSLFVNHPEGMFLYTGGVITITVINLVYRKEWDRGAKGKNLLWDMPEQMFVIYVRWVLPNMFVASYSLPQVVTVKDSLLVFGSGFALYALTGRWGLEWLERLRTGKNETIKSSETVTIEKKDETVSN
jgi:hypothetical protein